MDKQLKAQWVAALRSGEYRQGKGALRYDNAFCCLGVLCDISGEGEWDGDFYNVGNDSSAHLVPLDLAGKIMGRRPSSPLSTNNDGETSIVARGLIAEGGELGGESYPIALTEMNDNGFTFAQIADVIEREF